MGEGITAKCCHGVLMVKQEDEMIEVVQQSSMENSNKLLGSFLNYVTNGKYTSSPNKFFIKIISEANILVI